MISFKNDSAVKKLKKITDVKKPMSLNYFVKYLVKSEIAEMTDIGTATDAQKQKISDYVSNSDIDTDMISRLDIKTAEKLCELIDNRTTMGLCSYEHAYRIAKANAEMRCYDNPDNNPDPDNIVIDLRIITDMNECSATKAWATISAIEEKLTQKKAEKELVQESRQEDQKADIKQTRAAKIAKLAEKAQRNLENLKIAEKTQRLNEWQAEQAAKTQRMFTAREMLAMKKARI